MNLSLFKHAFKEISNLKSIPFPEACQTLSEQCESKGSKTLSLSKGFTPLRQRLRRVKVASPAFTIVELVIVITIMGILITLGVINMRSSQANGRDAERKTDIETIAQHLESYYTGGTYATTDFEYCSSPADTVTFDGSYTIHKFTSGTTTLSCPGTISAEVLVVGGGGSGGAAGGGAGGVVYTPNASMNANTTYNVVVGSGGASWDVTGGSAGGYHGGSSSINIPGVNTAKGGQGGFGWDFQPTTTMDIWASGAGSPQSSTGPYVSSGYTSGQGFPGGPDPDMNSSPFPSGGGGGAGGAGIKAGGIYSSNLTNGDGGIGIDMSATFSTTFGQNGWFAGGGAGSCHYEGCSASSGGKGGGGGVSTGCVSGTAGIPNTGSGGGGGINCPSSVSGAGGSGIVIVRYLTPNNLGTYPSTAITATLAAMTAALRDIDPKSLTSPGATGPINSFFSATNAVQTTAGVTPQPFTSADVINQYNYIYQPIQPDGTLCTSAAQECRKFNLYYRSEVDNTVQMVTSINQ